MTAREGLEQVKPPVRNSPSALWLRRGLALLLIVQEVEGSSSGEAVCAFQHHIYLRPGPARGWPGAVAR